MKIIVAMLVLLSGFSSAQLFAQALSTLDFRLSDSEPDSAGKMPNGVPLLELSEELTNQDAVAATSTNGSGYYINRLAAISDSV